MSDDPLRCMCPYECDDCTKCPAKGFGCHHVRQREDRDLGPLQRCRWCAPLRDREVRNERKAGKGKGSGSSTGESSTEAPFARLARLVDVLTNEVNELRRRVTYLEAVRM